MIRTIPSEQRFHADHGWLDTRFSFSFAEYYDPDNSSFGHLRVFNDDRVAPGTGFGMHPHRDMEIVTYVIEGALQHRDSMGNTGIIRPGEVQRMTAGTGILHSEFNPSETEPVHLLQIWVHPRERGLRPDWEQRRFPLEGSTNRLVPLVSGGDIQDTLVMHQDAVFYAAKLDPGIRVEHALVKGRLAHLFLIAGALRLNKDHMLRPGDAARITEEELLEIEAEEAAHFLLIDLGNNE